MVNRPEPSEIIPTEEAARRTGLTVRRLNKAAKKGELSAVIIDGEVLLLREPFERMMKGQRPVALAEQREKGGDAREKG